MQPSAWTRPAGATVRARAPGAAQCGKMDERNTAPIQCIAVAPPTLRKRRGRRANRALQPGVDALTLPWYLGCRISQPARAAALGDAHPVNAGIAAHSLALAMSTQATARRQLTDYGRAPHKPCARGVSVAPPPCDRTALRSVASQGVGTTLRTLIAPRRRAQRCGEPGGVGWPGCPLHPLPPLLRRIACRPCCRARTRARVSAVLSRFDGIL